MSKRRASKGQPVPGDAALIAQSYEQDVEAALLADIAGRFPGCDVCFFELRVDVSPTPTLFAQSAGFAADAVEALTESISDLLSRSGVTRMAIQMLSSVSVYAHVQLVPIYTAGTTLCAMLAICSRSGALPDDTLQRIDFPLKMLHVVAENRFLTSTMNSSVQAAQAILSIAQAMNQLPSPQEIIDILKEYVLTPDITGCAMLLASTQEDDRSGKPFEGLEIRGSWTRQHGKGVASGVRLHMQDYMQGLQLLESKRVIAVQDFRSVENIFDPLVRGLLKNDNARSLAFFALFSGDRMIGMLVLLSDKPGYFTARELHTFRMLSEFLSMGTVASILQQQRDQVQQVRASLMDSVSDGLVLVQPGQRGGKVLSSNPVFCHMFGVPPEDSSDFSLQDLLSRMILPEDVRRELKYQWINTPVRSDDTRRGEFRLMGTSSQWLDIQWLSAPVYLQGKVMGRVYTFHDVTSERTSIRMRDEFMSRISHELRTPLTSIQGFAEFILEVSGDTLPDVAREYTQIILSSAKQLRTIISDIIEVTRADAGQTQLLRMTVHLPDVLIDAAAQLEVQYKKRKQRVVLALDDDLAPVSIDRNRIVQVITNLISNAIKYAPESTTITVSVRLVADYESLPFGAPPDVVLPAALVEVHDEGQGIPPDEVDKVFTPFFRADIVKRRKIEGVGLGLPVSRSFIELHQGKVWAVPNTVAGGGLFVFTLPILREN
ncbi:MAG: PAS domain-containing protein [Pleurocapsa minor GSE-CHR-MK-17-07R]|nr:PAS domain-containing protein [Pleurocapsa minor GSE-CHR-MK 17-07R]